MYFVIRYITKNVLKHTALKSFWWYAVVVTGVHLIWTFSTCDRTVHSCGRSRSRATFSARSSMATASLRSLAVCWLSGLVPSGSLLGFSVHRPSPRCWRHLHHASASVCLSSCVSSVASAPYVFLALNIILDNLYCAKMMCQSRRCLCELGIKMSTSSGSKCNASVSSYVECIEGFFLEKGHW